MLSFDAATHTYHYAGRTVPGVTSILQPLTDYSRIPQDTLEIARQNGVAIHKMIELCARVDLDEDALPDWMRPALVAWKEFQSKTGFRIIASEFPVYHPTYGYAGTADLYGELVFAQEFALIDAKRSLLAGAAIGMQLAAYKEAYAVEHKEAKRAKRYALRINEKDPPRLQAYENAGDFTDFLTALNYKRLMERLAA